MELLSGDLARYLAGYPPKGHHTEIFQRVDMRQGNVIFHNVDNTIIK